MKKPKRKYILEWIPMGMFPGFVMFNYGFLHKNLMEELANQEASGYISAYRDDVELINEFLVLPR